MRLLESSLIPLSPHSLTGSSTQNCVAKMKLSTHPPSTLERAIVFSRQKHLYLSVETGGDNAQ